MGALEREKDHPILVPRTDLVDLLEDPDRLQARF